MPRASLMIRRMPFRKVPTFFNSFTGRTPTSRPGARFAEFTLARKKICLELCTLTARGCTLSVGREVEMEPRLHLHCYPAKGRARHAHFKALVRSSHTT